MLMFNRAFFSLQSNWIPTVIALGNLFLNAILDAVFYRVGVWGIPLATAVCNIAGTVALFILLRRRLGRVDGGAIASTVARVTVASAVAGGLSLVVWRSLDDVVGRSFPGQVVSLGSALAAAVAAYFVACRLLQVEELRVLSTLTRRVRG